jgi:hypothetical protein
MGDLYESLPEPAALTHTAIVKYRSGEESYEVFCPAASVRTVEWEDTHEPTTWLHCVGALSKERKGAKPEPMLKLLIPVQYITSIEAGTKCRNPRKKERLDVGIFPPENSSPGNQLSLEAITRIITALQVPLGKKGRDNLRVMKPA